MILFRKTLLLFILLSGCSIFSDYTNDEIIAPKLISKPKLIYPFAAQREERSGTSIIMLEISDSGIVEKTLVYKSSGHTDLDKAAMEYCKGFRFTPAMQNGNPITASMRWEINYDLEDFTKEILNNIDRVNRLYTLIEKVENDRKYRLQSEILNMHTSMIDRVNDGEKFNEYLYGVVNNNLRIVWEKRTDNYPLTFLLYHDFIERFGDYDSLAAVKNMLKNSLRSDIEYLTNTESDQKDFSIYSNVVL